MIHLLCEIVISTYYVVYLVQSDFMQKHPINEGK